MIEFQGVSKKLGGKKVLDGVELRIEDGETFVIVGSSGAGKSVTLKHMIRLLTPDEGRVLVDGDVVSEARGAQLEDIRNRFGFLFQSAALLQWLTVGDNVALPLYEHTRLSDDEIQEKVMSTLALVGLEDAVDKVPADLSGGMRKRVGLARAIVTEPSYILYDEPTSGLDPVTARTIDRLIDSLREELGVTSVVVTHDLHSALAIGTRIAMLSAGRIAEIATPEAFIASGEDTVKAFLEAQYITKSGQWERSATP